MTVQAMKDTIKQCKALIKHLEALIEEEELVKMFVYNWRTEGGQIVITNRKSKEERRMPNDLEMETEKQVQRFIEKAFKIPDGVAWEEDFIEVGKNTYVMLRGPGAYEKEA